MKRYISIFVILFASLNIQAKVGINADGSSPYASAMLDNRSTEKGVLIPQMSSTQRTEINSPATGLLVFDQTTEGFWFYNGTAWENLSGVTTSDVLMDSDGDTKVQVEEGDDEGYKSVDYSKLSALLIEGIKEQNNLIESLQSENQTIKAELQKQTLSFESRLAKIEGIMGFTAHTNDY